MVNQSKKFPVYIETGSKKVFAGSIDWPGWCRSGRDQASAVQALAGYGRRYARAIESAQLGFDPPVDSSAFTILERLKGDATTDFGSPGRAPSADSQPMDKAELERSGAILKACWREFDRLAKSAAGRDLRKGPRGGGRGREEIVRHVLEADAAYLAKIGWAFKPDADAGPAAELRRTRAAILEGLAAAAEGKLPARGPRGGSRWTPRYFVRRAAWHLLDHAWEIEDRID
jgi:hypothetical protein